MASRAPEEKKKRIARKKREPAPPASPLPIETDSKSVGEADGFAEDLAEEPGGEPDLALYSKKTDALDGDADPAFSSPEEAIARARGVVNTVDGTVVSVIYNKENGLPQTLIAEIPAGLYTRFCDELKKANLLKSPPPPAAAETGRLRVPIEFKFKR